MTSKITDAQLFALRKLLEFGRISAMESEAEKWRCAFMTQATMASLESNGLVSVERTPSIDKSGKAFTALMIHITDAGRAAVRAARAE